MITDWRKDLREDFVRCVWALILSFTLITLIFLFFVPVYGEEYEENAYGENYNELDEYANDAEHMNGEENAALPYQSQHGDTIAIPEPTVHPPIVITDMVDNLLRVYVTAGDYPVQAIFVNSRRFTHMPDRVLIFDISHYASEGEMIMVYAVDIRNNRSIMQMLNPPPLVTQNNITPEGQGEIVDHLTSADDIELITIRTQMGNIFFLVIDHTRDSNNVYFLNPVTEWDLQMLAITGELPRPPQGGQGEIMQGVDVGLHGGAATNNEMGEVALPEPEPTPAVIEQPVPVSQTQPSTPTMIAGFYIWQILLFAVACLGFLGVAYYFKVLKPRRESEDYYDDDDDAQGSDDGGSNTDNDNNDGDNDDDPDEPAATPKDPGDEWLSGIS